jgi:hypothetical protein
MALAMWRVCVKPHTRGEGQAMTATKTRSLRKYEGDHSIVAVDPREPKLEFFAPFGPLIAKTTIAPAVLQRVNAFADSMVKPAQSSEFLVPEDVAKAGGEDSLMRQIESQIGRYIEQTERTPIRNITVDVIWIVSQYAQSPSPVHFHSGDVSGVLYLKTPQIENEPRELEKTYISGRQAGHLNFLLGGKQRLSRTVTSVRPQVGDFYIFPGWLLHGAEPFRGEGERRSLSFNAFVTTDD